MSVIAPESTVRLHRLTMVAERDGYTVGRPDIVSYAVFPEEGAQALRMLDEGATVGAVAEWYERACGEPLDMADFLEAIEELGFVLGAGEERTADGPVRWQRLGRAVFSWPAWFLYLAVIAAGVAEMVRRPALRPSYHQMFFTGELSLIPIALTLVQIPTILVHEGFHALAGRRLGLPSTLRVSRRLYYVVAETNLDSLMSVPRRARYLPITAGVLADSVMACGLTLGSVALAGRGLPAWLPALLLAVSFTCVMRLLWQFMFYLQTDLYYLLVNMLHCADLQNATRFLIKSRWLRLLGRQPPEPADEWSPQDVAMARWYAPILISGYGFSLGSLAWVGLPAAVRFITLIAHRLDGTGVPVSGILDAASFIILTGLQFGIVAYVAVRDRRAARRTQASEGGLA